MVPLGVDQFVAQKFFTASAIFRQFDKDWSGSLSFKEWKKAMKALGYYMNKWDKQTLFWLIDKDKSGHISEREFCEYWAATH